jgi:hypothetical protein
MSATPVAQAISPYMGGGSSAARYLVKQRICSLTPT